MVQMIDERLVAQRQTFAIRIWSNNGNWHEVRAENAADAIKKNDAAIVAREAGLIRTFAVYATWLGIDEEDSVDISDDLKLSER